METTENGEDLSINIVMKFFPNVLAGPVAGSWNADEKERLMES